MSTEPRARGVSAAIGPSYKPVDGAEVADIRPFDGPLHGWYAVQGRRVILSMVISLDEGKGHVTGLLARWMTEYDEIHVPTPSNRMRGICERRGFKSEMVWMPQYDEPGECMVWRKPAEA